MSLAIDEAVVRIQQIQKALTITEIQEIVSGSIAVTPLAVSIKRAYPYFPPSSKAITDTPCFINSWTAPEIKFQSVLMSGLFSVRSQLLVRDADTDRAAAIASAFWPKILTAFAANIKLNAWAPATVLAIRGRDPTLTVLEFAGQSYVGLDFDIDIYLNKAQVMEA